MKFLIIAGLSLFCFFSFSQTAYVNFEQFFEKTKEGKTIRQKVKKEFESRRSKIQKREKQLQKEQMELNSEAGLLSDSEKRSRLQKMQKKAMEFQRSLENNERELEEYRTRLITRMEDNLKPVLAKIANDKKLTKVERMTKNVLWVPKDADITDIVVRAYNKKY